MPGLPKEDLHRAVLDALGDDVESAGPVATVPFVVKLRGILRLALWAFTITSPPGGRHPLESKIQLIVPGQARGARGSLASPDEESFLILLGFKPEERLFVLWDAYKHLHFAYSKNVQVRAQPLIDALTFGLGHATRSVATGVETIIAARSDRLYDALRERITA